MGEIVGGGKSALGCLWLIEQATKHAGTRWLMGRSKLKTLKETTLNTFFELTNQLGMGGDFTYNAQSNIIYFKNGSEIILKDLFFYPSDPNFDSLGSLEISGAFIDECNQITYKAWQIVKSRIRFKLKEFNIYPKILGTCNPAKNWTYTEFYKPNKTKQILSDRKFIQALPTDNPHLPSTYIETLKSLDKNSRERLLLGNWEYDDDPSALCGYENITNIFSNIPYGIGKYITCDVARLGSDKAVILVWSGYSVIEQLSYAKCTILELKSAIEGLRVKYNVPTSNIVADEDGVGGGLVDALKIKGFVNNSKALKGENYFNLQSQCCYLLAEKINNNLISFLADIGGNDKQQIIEELEQLKTYEADKDGRLRILPKEQIKENIGRSPDWRDALMMRMFFDVYKGGTGAFV